MKSTLTILTNIGAVLLGLGTSVLLSRLLGPSGRGEIAATMLWPQTLVYVASLGVQEATMYLAARDDSCSKEIIVNSYFLSIVQAAIVVPLGYFLIPRLLVGQSAEVVNVSRIFLLMTPFSLLALNGLGLLRGHLRIGTYNSIRIVIPIGYLAGALFLALGSYLNLLSIIILHVVLNATVFALTSFVVAKGSLHGDGAVNMGMIKSLLSYGIKGHIGSLAQLMNLRMDQLFIAALLPPEQLGYYVVAVGASGIVQVVPSAFRTVIAPRVAQRDAHLPAADLEKILRKSWLITLFTGLAAFAAVPLLIPALYGDLFRDSIGLSAVLVVAAVFSGDKDILVSAAYGLGSPGLASRAEAVSLIITALGLWFLLPRMGVMGAAVTTLLAYAVAFGTLIHGLGRHHGHRPRNLVWIRASDVVELVHEMSELQPLRSLIAMVPRSD